MSKALARLHRAPALCFALAITTAETVIVAAIAESIDVQISVATSEVAETARSLRLFGNFVRLKG
jgi:hypothetical protein